jgi:hypothetical protein
MYYLNYVAFMTQDKNRKFSRPRHLAGRHDLLLVIEDHHEKFLIKKMQELGLNKSACIRLCIDAAIKMEKEGILTFE